MPSKNNHQTKIIAGYEVPQLTRSYFMSWGDAWNPYISEWLLLRPALHIKWLTPNIVTIMSIITCLSAGLLLVFGHGDYYLFASFLLFITPILDCLDGRIARITKRSSQLGDYLDKTFDVMKIG